MSKTKLYTEIIQEAVGNKQSNCEKGEIHMAFDMKTVEVDGEPKLEINKGITYNLNDNDKCHVVYEICQGLKVTPLMSFAVTQRLISEDNDNVPLAVEVQ